MSNATQKLMNDRRDFIALQPGTIWRVVAVGLAVFLWGMLFVWQGLDFTDTGYFLTGYQQFYSFPGGIKEMMDFWLTLFVGHWLGWMLGGTYISYHIAAVLIFAATAMAAYTALAMAKGHSWLLAIFTFLTFLVIRKHVGIFITYDYLTGLFMVVGALLLLKGLFQESSSWIAGAGVVLGASIFVRFPNILAFALVSTVWVHAWLSKWPPARSIAWSGWFTVGYVSGIFLILAAIMLQGDGTYYMQSIREIFGLATDSGSSYSGSSLMQNLILDYIKAFKFSIPLITAGSLFAWGLSGKGKWLQATLIAGCAAFMAAIFTYENFWQWALPGLLYIGLGCILWLERKRNKKIFMLAFLALAVLVITPLGSGAGIYKAVYGMWLALPLVLAWLWGLPEEFKLKGVALKGVARTFALVMVIILALNALITAWFFTYYDTQDRLAMHYSIPYPILRGTFTTEGRAKSTGEMLGELQRWVHPGGELLAYGEIPLVHFLTQTTPWLDNPWPELYRLDGGKKMISLMDNKTKAGAALPVVVRAIKNLRRPDWSAINGGDFPADGRIKIIQILNEFVAAHGYRMAWSNDSFEIWVPEDLRK